MAIGISGVDDKIVQELMEGDEDFYASVLRAFVAKAPDVLIKLKGVSSETIADYAITIHGFKGACANICAEEARKMAYNLEQMSRKGDLDGVLAENDSFLKYMENLMVTLKDWLGKHQK
jgi:HPt (histidine-containing phosphotransfer) domain-containing protein